MESAALIILATVTIFAPAVALLAIWLETKPAKRRARRARR